MQLHDTLLVVAEHTSAGYAGRTRANARSAQLTAAFALDYNTGGERLTHRVAGASYVALPLTATPLQNARMLYRALRDRQASTLNIAGNGIRTLHQHGWTQMQVDFAVLTTISRVHAHWPLTHIFSGGQTGADLSGLIAAQVLGIPATGTFPLGFIQRGINGLDVPHTREEITSQVLAGAEAVREVLRDLALLAT